MADVDTNGTPDRRHNSEENASEVILTPTLRKVILYPTDTVWGIGCDATDRKAVRRVYEIKRRVDTKAMLVS